MGTGEPLDSAEDPIIKLSGLIEFHFKPKSLRQDHPEDPVYLLLVLRPALELGKEPEFLIPKEGMKGTVSAYNGRIIGKARVTRADLDPAAKEETELTGVTVSIVPEVDFGFATGANSAFTACDPREKRFKVFRGPGYLKIKGFLPLAE